jgi:hypothetical protein
MRRREHIEGIVPVQPGLEGAPKLGGLPGVAIFFL